MKKILVVDAESIMRISFEKLINWKKYNLILSKTCSNGKEALEYMLNNSIDILITDIKMPIMDGLTLVKELKNRGISPEVIIILSAFDEYDFIRTSFKLGVDDYILKSNYNQEYIIEIILKALDKKAPSIVKKKNNFFSTEINAIIDFLEKNYYKNISLKTICTHVSYSESYLSHIFSKETGISIIDYLNRLRIEKAKEALSSSDYKVYEVATKVGFQSVEHFSRTFKRITGTSPKRYKSI